MMEAFDRDFFLSQTKGTVPVCKIFINKETASTNLDAVELVRTGIGENALIIAETQTDGRGTKGRSFFSSAGGVFFSLILSNVDKELLNRLTPTAAVAAARAASTVSGEKVEIKWVNDIIAGGKKVCGILCEALLKGNTASAIIGVGANIYEPENGFPDELNEIAGTLCGRSGEKLLRERFTAEFLNEFFRLLKLSGEGLLNEYTARSCVLGKEIYVIKKNRKEKALAIGIANDFCLVVKYECNTIEKLLSDEVSVRIV